MRKGITFQYLLGGALLFVYVGMAVFGLMSISNSEHTMGAMHHQTPCPFIVGQQALCTMGALDHISAWQKVLLVDVQPALALAVVMFVGVLPLLFFVIGAPPGEYVFYKKGKPFIPALFAQGILHPKAP